MAHHILCVGWKLGWSTINLNEQLWDFRVSCPLLGTMSLDRSEDSRWRSEYLGIGVNLTIYYYDKWGGFFLKKKCWTCHNTLCECIYYWSCILSFEHMIFCVKEQHGSREVILVKFMVVCLNGVICLIKSTCLMHKNL